jgi:hypothetical protein
MESMVATDGHRFTQIEQAKQFTANPHDPRLVFLALYLLVPLGADQFCRSHALATLLSSFPMWSQMLPPLHRFCQSVFANVSHCFGPMDPVVSQFAHEFLACEANVFDNLP